MLAMQNKIWNASSLLLGVLTVAACAAPGPPPKELVDARLAIQDAKTAKADRLATHTYDSAAAYLDVVNKSWEKDHDASAVLHQARLAEAEARKAQYASEAQMAEETIRLETNRKNRNDIAIRDAELVLAQRKGREAELAHIKALAKEREQALLDAKAKFTAEQARAEREATKLREEYEKTAALSAEQARTARAELEAAQLRGEEGKMAALAAEQARAEGEATKLREEYDKKMAALTAEQARTEREAEATRLREEQEKLAALAAEQARAENAEREVARLRAEQEKSRGELRATLSHLAQVREEARGVIVTLPGNIFFDFNKADVKPAMQEKLTEIAKALAAVPDQNLLIEGHTDSDGSSEYNLTLSEQRAQSVRSILLAGGIPAERMKTKGYGQTTPVAPNSTATGKAQNRRVEIVLQSTK
jgi:outer membrane protein OmpA-like peptidoglycan-associated protein